jgi:hypothetical protein
MSRAQTFFRQAPLYTDSVDYLILRLPARAITVAAGILAELSEPFGALVVDKDEVTLVIPAEVREDFQKRLLDASYSQNYRLITFDLVLPPDLTGFMAWVTGLLAEANIPLIPLGAYSRDHLLIPSAHFVEAWALLTKAQQT